MAALPHEVEGGLVTEAGPVVVIAVDFGTHGSGFAFSLVDTEGNAQGPGTLTFEEWPGQPVHAPKTRSAILYEGFNVAAWGWTATQLYAQASGAERSARQLQYYENFKLGLLEEVPQGMQLTLPPGRPHGPSVEQVAADFLKHLTEFALQHVAAVAGRPITKEQVVWVMGFPEMSSYNDRDRLRKVAKRAGLMSGSTLLLASEPELAALYAHRGSGEVQLQEGEKFLVIDAGGGTVDVTLHEVVHHGSQPSLSERAVGAGAACGASKVDAAWRAAMAERLGADNWQRFQEDYPRDFIWLQGQWEQAKCAFTGSEDSNSNANTGDNNTSSTGSTARRGRPPKNPLRTLAEQLTGQSFDDPHQDATSSSISTGWTHIRLPASLVHMLSSDQCTAAGIDNSGPGAATIAFDTAAMCSLFDPAADEAVALAFAVLGGCGAGPSDSVRVLLAGGFSESVYLQRRLQEALGRSECPCVQEVVLMKHAGAAVMQGAVISGLAPQAMYARRSRLTYGLRVCRKHKEGAPSQTWHDTDKDLYCCECFTPYVRRGQLVQVEELASHAFTPWKQDQDSFVFEIFGTGSECPADADVYTCNEGMHKVASVTLHWPERLAKPSRASHALLADMKFGTSELQVTARDAASGEQADVSLNFAHEVVSRGVPYKSHKSSGSRGSTISGCSSSVTEVGGYQQGVHPTASFGVMQGTGSRRLAAGMCAPARRPFGQWSVLRAARVAALPADARGGMATARLL